ncbi:MAG: hypothetical protein B6U65_04680 [Candidatus Wolframiiraptor sp. EX4484-121]|nr:MAG: hypothetical protein B6U65_04680 [Candidatus Wolframiiraptor sp. EX4484-121]
MNRSLKELIREQLMIDEQNIISDVLPKAKEFIRLTKDGKPVIIADRSRIPKIYHVLLYLFAKKLAYLAELTDSPGASIKEISSALDFPENYTRALLSELLSKGFIQRSERGIYVAETMRMKEAISTIEAKLRGSPNE